MNIISRWWQSKGFGIQSKTDFAFLHDVILEKLPYYAYETMQEEFPNVAASDVKSAQLLFRLCNTAKGKNITIVGTLKPIEQRACELSNAKPLIVNEAKHFHNTNMLIVKDIDNSNKQLWHNVLSSRCITYDTTHIGIALFYSNRNPEHYHI